MVDTTSYGFSCSPRSYSVVKIWSFVYSKANPYPRTPAMVAGVSNHVWTIEEIVMLLD